MPRSERSSHVADWLSGAKVFSFDGDMTLWDFEKSMRYALSVVLQELRSRYPGHGTEDLSVDRLIGFRSEVAGELGDSRVTMEEIRRRSFRRVLQSLSVDDERAVSEITELYLRHRQGSVEVYPDVIPCLRRLRIGYRVGLVTNGNTDPRRCGVAALLDFSVYSTDVGIEKPHPDIFLAACRQALCLPTELVHVGDSLESDVAGAIGVGARAVWLNRAGMPNGSDVVPDLEIVTLSELTEPL